MLCDNARLIQGTHLKHLTKYTACVTLRGTTDRDEFYLPSAAYVVDSSNSPVEGARVHLDNTSFSVATDSLGAYWRPVPPGGHWLTVVADG